MCIRDSAHTSCIPAACPKLVLFRGQGNKNSKVTGGQIRAQLPYIRSDVPVVLVFRALGYTNDKAILEHIVYDFSDTDMMEKFRYFMG